MKTTRQFITRRQHRARLGAAAVAFALIVSACGDDSTQISAGGGNEDESTQTTNPPDADLPTGDEPVQDPTPNDDWVRTVPRDDLVQVQAGEIIEVIIDPDNPSVLLVRYQGAAEPCSGAGVVVTESADRIDLQFFVGLDPNAAAMTCVAAVFNYEVAVPLEAPAGDRGVTISAF